MFAIIDADGEGDDETLVRYANDSDRGWADGKLSIIDSRLIHIVLAKGRTTLLMPDMNPPEKGGGYNW